eukprot:gene84-92_t
MATVMKAKRPAPIEVKAAPVSSSSTSQSDSVDENMSVEKYLEAKFEEMLQDFRNHAEGLVAKLRQEYKEGMESINGMMPVPAFSPQVVVTLKCIAGPHIGQRFRLEPSTNDGEDVFKMGRSTGKLFKEKGVSLYKDKEISTTHAKIELRNGQAFVIDMRSTNGSQLNGEDLEPQTPYRLKDQDVIVMGSTELQVTISDQVDQENIPAN